MLTSLVLILALQVPGQAAGQSFEVTATIRSVDAEKGTVQFRSGQQDRISRVDPGAAILDAQGKPLADRLKAAELKAGAVVTLTVMRDGDRPLIKSIRLGAAVAPTEPAAAVVKQDTSALTPLTDLSVKEYQGFQGGLYPEGKNTRPPDHEAAGRALDARVTPLDAEGKPSADGKIVLLGIGFSNTVQAFQGFMDVAKDDPKINPKVVLVNGAVGGMSAAMVQHTDDNARGTLYWKTVDERLQAAGVTRAQVQAVWIKETNPAPHVGGFPKYVRDLQAQLGAIVRIVHDRFPNARLAYFSSRTYGGWAKPRPNGTPAGNSEPFSYESGFAVKWLIEQQLGGDAALNHDATKGPLTAPWLSWGPYLWSNGPIPRSDGFVLTLDDFRENDRMHESPSGMRKVGTQLLRFFETDATTKGWFVRE